MNPLGRAFVASPTQLAALEAPGFRIAVHRLGCASALHRSSRCVLSAPRGSQGCLHVPSHTPSHCAEKSTVHRRRCACCWHPPPPDVRPRPGAAVSRRSRRCTVGGELRLPLRGDGRTDEAGTFLQPRDRCPTPWPSAACPVGAGTRCTCLIVRACTTSASRRGRRALGKSSAGRHRRGGWPSRGEPIARVVSAFRDTDTGRADRRRRSATRSTSPDRNTPRDRGGGARIRTVARVPSTSSGGRTDPGARGITEGDAAPACADSSLPARA